MPRDSIQPEDKAPARAEGSDHGVDATDATTVVTDVYQQLRRLAQRLMSDENPGQTIQATELVHEAYLKLDGPERSWADSQHFFLVAARAMRQILVDRARRKATVRRGGGRRRLDLDDADGPVSENSVDLVSLDAAIDRLAQEHERAAQVVMLRYFAGLSGDQVAHTLGISPATEARDWAFARAQLYRELEGSHD